MSDIVILPVPVFSTLCNAAFALRREVFVWEQNVPEEEEHDQYDLTAIHFVAIADGEVVATLRLIEMDEHCKIGRVATRLHYRGRGIGKKLIAAAMDHARARGRIASTSRRNRTSWAFTRRWASWPSAPKSSMAACRTAPCATTTRPAQSWWIEHPPDRFPKRKGKKLRNGSPVRCVDQP